jgi:hypothetical protein
MKPSVAIIVPFRLQKGQERQKELDEFLPYMEKYLTNEINLGNIEKYHIYVIKQTGSYEDDSKKFNRGMLLNIGVVLAHGDYDTFIFHDVDLLPNNELADYYTICPKTPIHIAGCWSRYNKNPNYFGGIVSFDRKCFNIINGFPNDFWGWGGEDDALLNRCRANDISPYKVGHGSVLDIESGGGYQLVDKLNVLRKHSEWKCSDKWERIEEDKNNWRSDGLRQVDQRFKVLGSTNVKDYSMVEVELH